MIIIPAIDILDGQCVRLLKGDYDSAKTYFAKPAEAARSFEDMGVKRLHIVDLDAARSGVRKNRKAIHKIRKAFNGVIELGGGIRKEEDIEELIDAGIDRLILGTILAKRPDIVEGWVHHFGQMFIAGIDALEGMVKVSGWEDSSSLSDIDLACKSKRIGLSSIIYTSISRDGTLEGPDVERTNLIAGKADMPVILSGGISGDDDIALAAKRSHKNVKAIITGKAYYEGRINLASLIETYQPEEGEALW